MRKIKSEKNMTVQVKIKSIASRIEGTAYLFMNWAQTNVALDTIDKPTIVYVLPPSGTLNVKYASVTDSPLTQIAFLDKTDFDFDSTENDEVIERMKGLFYTFLREYNKGEYFEPIEGDIPYQVVYDKLDVNVTGIVVTLTLVELEGSEIC